MNIVIPHHASMVRHRTLHEAAAASDSPIDSGAIWINDGLTHMEQQNVDLIRRFWECWTELPLDLAALGNFFAPDVVVRTGWRGEFVMTGRETALAGFAHEAQRQAEHKEKADYRFPIVVAKGPVLFHTWVWIAWSDELGYHIERPMAACYLITNGLIERWDSYATGTESELGFTGGTGPDGL